MPTYTPHEDAVARYAALPEEQRTDYERASEDDRRWFAAHPGRSHRLRQPIGREADALWKVSHTPALLVAVRQLEPGTRHRVGYPGHPSLGAPPNRESVARAAYDFGAEVTFNCALFRPPTPAQILRLAAPYRSGDGRAAMLAEAEAVGLLIPLEA
jgi:hypothetical protein